MTVTIHVDPCPTCDGTGRERCECCGDVPCDDCDGLGYQIPEWTDPCVKCDRPIASPDPRYKPGATIIYQADCRNPMITTPVTEAWHGAGFCCDGSGKVTVATRIVDQLAPVIDVPGEGYPLDAPWRFFYVSRPGSLRLVDMMHSSDTYICPATDIDCSPDDVLAHLTEGPT